MTLDQAITYFGTPQDVAEKLGVSPARISQLKKDGLSYSHQCILQIESGGDLKADKPDRAASAA